jgi:hypothetical protein
MKKYLFLPFAALLVSSCYDDGQAADYDYENGQTLTFMPKLAQTVDSVVYYWDEQYIATEREMPFVLRYTLSGQASGVHKLSYNIYSPNTDGSYSRIGLNTTIRIK